MPDSIPQLEQKVASAASVTEKVDALNGLAWEVRRHDIARAIDLSREAYALASESTGGDLSYPTGAADSLSNLVIFYQIQGSYEDGLSAGFEAVALCETIGYTTGLPKVYRGLGNLNNLLGNYADSLAFHLKSLQLSESLGLSEEIIRALNSTGACYSELGEYHKSLELYQRALTLLDQENIPPLRAQVYNNMAMEYLRLHEFDAALKHALLSNNLYHQLGDPAGELHSLGTLAEVYIDREQYDEALDCLQKHNFLAETTGYRWQFVLAQILMARSYNRKHMPAEAIPYAQATLAMAEEMKTREMVYKSHRELADAYEMQGDFPKALYHFQQYHTVRDRMLSEENARRVQSLRASYEIRVAQQEAEFYRREKERIEDQREQDRQYFERLAQMKDDLVSNASHDLKNPLTNILLFADLVRGQIPPDSSEGHEYLRLLVAQAERMQALISDVLDLARVETGRAMTRQVQSINELLVSALHEQEYAAEQKGLLIDFQPIKPDEQAALDPQQMRRAVNNLLSNAVKYTPKGGSIRVWANAKSGAVQVYVADTGIGIPANDLPFVFDPFYRVNEKQHLSVEGTGLGLAITRSIIQQHQGEIAVTSTPGKGTEFVISLPLAEEAQLAL